MSAKSEDSKVTYQTFVNDLDSGLISSADLYSYGGVDFTYLTKDGTLRSVDIPHEASQNSLLTYSLASKSVEYVSHDTSYPDDSDNGMGMAMWSSSFIFLIPILLIGIIFYQSRVIASLGAKLADVRNVNKNISSAEQDSTHQSTTAP